MEPITVIIFATLLCFLIAVIASNLPRIFKQYRKWKLLRALPLPECVPYHWLLGHIPSLYKQDEGNLEFITKELYSNPDKTLWRVVLGFTTIVGIQHPKHVAAILKEPKTSYVYDLIKPWLGDGLLIAGGKKWFRNRRLLTPAFHYKILEGYVPVYNSCLSILLDKWSASVKKGEHVVLFGSLSLLSLDIIMQSAFSFKSNCQQSDIQLPYVKACSNLVYYCTDRVMNPFYMVDWIYWLTSHGRRTKNACRLVHRHAEKVISERKHALLNNGDDSKKYLDFLDILLMARDEEGKEMTDLEIRNEVDTFMFEGHDTTTSGMSWTLYCLAQHPQHQDKIREEVKSVLKDRKWLEYKDLKHLNYTMWCIKEAMRLYPPVFSFYRKTTEEIKLNNYTIPCDTIISTNVFSIHRNPTVWESPTEYDPLRFDPSRSQKLGPYDYIPFSAGNRNCIGQNFAMNEMKVVVGTLVNFFSFEVEANHPIEMVPRVVLRTKYDIKLCLKQL